MRNWGPLYARLALGAAFLSAVASRFGLWQGHLTMERFAGFARYTAEVNAFMPAVTIPFLAWGATVAEATLGLALVLGIRPRRTAFAAAALLALFGTAMAVSLGPQSPLDYSVFSASAAGVLLAQGEPPAPPAPWPPAAVRRWWSRLPRLRHRDDLARGVIGLL